MEFKVLPLENPHGYNLILGHSHFIKSVEDIHEAIVSTVPFAKFGMAFCEASEKRLVRWSGTDEELIELAKNNAYAIAAGHTFLIFMRDMFPINILNAIKRVPEVARIHCATANPLQIVLVETDQGRGILGVVDGYASAGIETEEDIAARKGFLRKIGYKL